MPEVKQQPTAETIRHLRHQITERIPEVEETIKKSGSDLELIATRLKINMAGDLLRKELTGEIDPLTGLFNLKGYESREQKELKRARTYGHPISVAVIDTNGLKEINDTQGHDVGDEFLRKVANVLRESTRLSDVIARVGGDEFKVLLTETNIEEATAWEKRLKELFQKKGISASLGTSAVDVNDVLSSTREADRRMYENKRRHKEQEATSNDRWHTILSFVKKLIERTKE